MSKLLKVLYLIILVIPWSLSGLYVYKIFSISFSLPPDMVKAEFNEVSKILIMAGISIIAVFALYVFHIKKFNNQSEDKKDKWIAALLFAHIIIMPIYWYRFIWSGQDKEMQG